MIKKLKDLWASLPHQVQAALIFGGSATMESIAHAISEGKIPMGATEIEHFLYGAIVTGTTAAWAFYRMPNGKAQLVDQATAFNAAAAKAAEAAKPPTPPQP